jgi:hypothetical protein
MEARKKQRERGALVVNGYNSNPVTGLIASKQELR